MFALAEVTVSTSFAFRNVNHASGLSTRRRGCAGHSSKEVFRKAALLTKEDFMIEKCANPSCNQLFRDLRAGTLFFFGPSSSETWTDLDLQGQDHRIESFWLCEQCASGMTIISNSGCNPVIIPLLQVDGEQVGTA
jgi:hypothetical protein